MANHSSLHPVNHLTPTLFDRLRDNEPSRKTEHASEYTVTPQQLRNIVRRDLMYLLNTISQENDPEINRYPQVAASVVNYGIPPLTGHHSGEQKWPDIAKIIKRAICRFEPRLDADTLQVVFKNTDKAQQNYNVLLFEISGQVLSDPWPTPFLVQSSFDLENQQIILRDN